MGKGFIDVSQKRKCSPCPENTYNNDAGSMCTPCEKGYDTNGKTGATFCLSM